VICGTADKVTPLELNRRIAEGIPGATLVPIQVAGHWLFLEFADAFNAAVLEFLD
jgi:pimeloyl-ACP methyl ester carboxylesterase